MAQVKQFVLPDLGEGLTEGEVLRWLVAVGDTVEVNQPLAEVETAKAAVELPSPYAGTVSELHAEPGAVLPVGAPLVSLSVEGAAADESATAPATEPANVAPADAPPQEGSGPVLVGYGVTAAATQRRARRAGSPHGTVRPEAGPPGEPVKPVRHGGLEVGRAAERRFADQSPTAPVRAKPPVRRLARELGVDLAAVRPTGHDGVVTRQDVESAAALGSPTADTATAWTAAVSLGGLPARDRGESREDVRGVTRLMAEAMTRSAFTVPHVTEWLEVDVTRSVELLDRLRSAAAFDGVRVTPMLLVARAVVAGLRRNPLLNAVYDADAQQVVHRGGVNLGIAAATPRGLVVPSIKDADRLSLPDLGRALATLTETAKAGRSTPADLTGGTFTVTNVGALGVDGGTPIINPGESAILAVGAWRAKPWVHQGQIAVRTVCTLSLSFDHRIIDGATGSRFLVDVAQLLEEPAADLAW
jgi:2-oxoisovalerate dehydrogenase E2 component (dihydrolipoyl transacylase)